MLTKAEQHLFEKVKFYNIIKICQKDTGQNRNENKKLHNCMRVTLSLILTI